MTEFGPACGYEGEHYHAPGVDPNCLSCDDTPEQPEPTKAVRKWADSAMFEAEKIDPTTGPQVQLLSCNSDPLGSVAAAAKAYVGEFVTSLAEITDDERRYYLEQMQRTALAMPLESVHFQFHISGVTRGFTHQMVRQRTAAYSQESTRFAVKDGAALPVGLPPSIAGTEGGQPLGAEYSKAEWQRNVWDECVEHIGQAYLHLVESGMPAEDARGLLPTNLLTQINYHTNLRNFLDEGGKRLCTQAQFEWRVVFAKMLEAIRAYPDAGVYQRTAYGKVEFGNPQWQFDAIADLFRPVCYAKGRCVFNADFDRKCSIRQRVEANATHNRPSSEWHLPLRKVVGVYESETFPGNYGDEILTIPAIKPEEWLMNPAAAR